MLLIKLISNRKFLSLVTICSSGMSVVVTLCWNTHLSDIIDAVSIGRSPSGEMIMMALVTMFVMGATNYMSGYITGYTCESLTHDLRMGYARYFMSLPVAESEKLNAGEQLSKLQNEISSVSDYPSV